MKEFFTKNLGLKIIALVLAVLVWVVAVNFSNPEIKASKQVEVGILNGDVIENAGKTYELLSSTTVTINYSVRTRDAYKVKASDFKAYIDMNDLYDVTGSVPIVVEIVDNKDIILDATAKPSVIRVQVEDVVKLSKEVTFELDGEPQEGYTVGSVDLNPSNITISGPASIVTQIKDIKIVIDVNGINEDIAGSATPVFVDSIGRTVDVSSDNVHVNHQTVAYYVTTLVGKTVPVQYNVSGTPADGYSFAGVSATINQVVIRGSKASLAEVNSIVVPKEKLSVDGASENREITVDLSAFLPSGLQIVGESNSVVTLMVEGQETQHFTISSDQFAIANGIEGFSYVVQPTSIDVEVAGLKEDLAALDSKDILATIDVGEISETGTFAVEPIFTLPAGYTVKAHGDVTVEVTATSMEAVEKAKARAESQAVEDEEMLDDTANDSLEEEMEETNLETETETETKKENNKGNKTE